MVIFEPSSRHAAILAQETIPERPAAGQVEVFSTSDENVFAFLAAIEGGLRG